MTTYTLQVGAETNADMPYASGSRQYPT